MEVEKGHERDLSFAPKEDHFVNCLSDIAPGAVLDQETQATGLPDIVCCTQLDGKRGGRCRFLIRALALRGKREQTRRAKRDHVAKGGGWRDCHFNRPYVRLTRSVLKGLCKGDFVVPPGRRAC